MTIEKTTTELSNEALNLQYELEGLGSLIRDLRARKDFYQSRFHQIQRAKQEIETILMERDNQIKKLNTAKKPHSKKSKSNKETHNDLIKDLTKALKGMSEEDIKSLIESKGE